MHFLTTHTLFILKNALQKYDEMNEFKLYIFYINGNNLPENVEARVFIFF